VSTHIKVWVVVLLDGGDPGEHVVRVLRLQQVLAAVVRLHAEHILALRVAVRDVHDAGLDRDRLLVVGEHVCLQM